MRLEWSRVIDFIVRRDAALPSSFVGVRQSEIDAVQAQYRITLPSTYVDFLRTMGENSGELYPFGKTYVHAFSKLLEQLPPEDYPAQRFFKVVFVAEEFAMDPIDTYLDLSRSDGHDAPLVEFETPLGPNETNFSEDHLSFAERFIYNLFRRLDVDWRRYGADIVVFGRGAWNGTEIKQAALNVLTRSGFAAALPDLRCVGCMSRESVSALISVSDKGKLVKFEMGGDSLEAVEESVRDLLAAFPGAKLSGPPAERADASGS
jgi:hypothetical protein